MTLAAGSRVGSYEIVAAIGAGGMGEVYRARDTQLKRDVALKVLPADVATDANRLGRFQREAELLAALNHPCIAQIYGLTETGGVRALVLELVEGPTLAERLARGPLPLDEALAVAIQLAQALEYAHEHGIVHRDFKPANIKLAPDGAVKVLDFGLAKALEAGPAAVHLADSPTQPSPAVTRAGVILGTAAYMSPEQARGAAVDKRADIWAFGVVLYEMLTGRACFSGETVTDILVAVVRSEPDWRALPAETPGPVRRLIHRCLAKDRRQRLHDIADARLELEQALAPDVPGSAEPSTPLEAGMVAASRRFRTYAFALVLLTVLALAAASVAYWLAIRPPAPRPVIHADLALPEGHALVASPAISPDGSTVAFVSQGPSERPRLRIRRIVEDFEVQELTGTDEADQPFFSPDGRSVAFFAKRQLYRVRLDGGAPVAIASAPNPRGGTWGDDDSIVFAPSTNGGLVRIAAGAEQPQPLIQPDGDTNYGFVLPRFLPGARELLFSVWGRELGPARLNLATLQRSGIVSGSGNAVYAASGHVIIGGRVTQEGELLAVPDTARVSGRPKLPVPVQQKVFRSVRSATSWFDLSLTGTLVYAVADISRNTVVSVDQAGRVTSTLMGDRAYYDATPALSPDATRIAYARLGRIRVRNLERGTDEVLTTEDGAGTLWDDRAPVWTPDGRRIVFGSNRAGNWDVLVKDASGGGMADPVVQRPLNQLYPVLRRQDGTMAFVESHPATSYDIWLLSPDGKLEAALATPANEVSPAFSSDGRFVAYTSDESGRPEVYLSQFARPLRRGAVISAEGGVCPAWSPKQSRLFFWQGTKMMAVDVRSDGSPAGSPRMLFDGGWLLSAPGGIIRPTIGNTTCFEVMPDGEHFLMVRADPEAIPTRMHVIFNWFEELKAKVPLD